MYGQRGWTEDHWILSGRRPLSPKRKRRQEWARATTNCMHIHTSIHPRMVFFKQLDGRPGGLTDGSFPLPLGCAHPQVGFLVCT
jgi:hypothetical protein